MTESVALQGHSLATAASIEGAIDDDGLAQVMVGAALFALRAKSGGQGGPLSALETAFAGRVAGLAVFAWELLGAALAGDGAGLCGRAATPEFNSHSSKAISIFVSSWSKIHVRLVGVLRRAPGRRPAAVHHGRFAACSRQEHSKQEAGHGHGHGCPSNSGKDASWRVRWDRGRRVEPGRKRVR